jgi:hypothetical protein
MKARMWWVGSLIALAVCVGGMSHAVAGEIYEATPQNLKQKINALKPGDTLNLKPGQYTGGMRIQTVRGTADAWITIQGPAEGEPAVFLARSRANTITIKNSAYVALKHLTLDGKGMSGVDGIKASFDRPGPKNPPTHHILIEGCTIKDHGGSQNTCGISTKTPTWGWIIRNNKILNAGTGLYLGNSDGRQPFVNGVIENNLVKDPVGYCMQIKYQVDRPALDGMPKGPCTTIIRNNVFIKDDKRSPAGNRPNLLVGNFPKSGPGAQDRYEIYGNLLVHNPRESLLQVAGGVTIHDNIFADVKGAAIRVQVNRGNPVRHTSIYNNTIYAAGTAVSIGDRAKVDEMVGNLILARAALRGKPAVNKGNLVDSVANAGKYVKQPSIKFGAMDFYPLPGKCQGEPLDLTPFAKNTDYDRDFNGTSKGEFKFVGAYAGEGENPGWALQAGNKVGGPASTPEAKTP